MSDKPSLRDAAEQFGNEKSAAPAPPVDLAGLTMEQLLDLRHKIDERLPATRLKDMDMEQELVIQYQMLKAFQARMLHAGDSIPQNQKTGLLNACTAGLQALAKMQESVYASERVKLIESCLEKALTGLPRQSVLDFMARYEAQLNETMQVRSGISVSDSEKAAKSEEKSSKT